MTLQELLDRKAELERQLFELTVDGAFQEIEPDRARGEFERLDAELANVYSQLDAVAAELSEC